MFVGKFVQIVISAFRCSAKYFHSATVFPYEQAMVFENSVISVELKKAIAIDSRLSPAKVRWRQPAVSSELSLVTAS